MRTLPLGVLFTSAALFAPGLSHAAQLLTVDDAVNLALRQSPGIQAAHDRVRAAEDTARSHRGRMLPGVHLSDEYQHYNKEFSVVFALPGLPPGITPPSFVARDQDTNTFAAGARQPVLGLLHLYEEHEALNLTADATRAQADTSEAAIREAVKNGYLRLFEAKATEGIAQESQKQLDEQVQVAEAKLKAGAITNADLLRIQVALANVKQQTLQAQVSERVARANLITLLGLASDADVDFAEPTKLEEGGQTQAYEAARAQALKQRPEIRQVELNAEAAQRQAKARFYELLPEVNVNAAYTHITGQAFAPANQAYVGVTADWPIWDWGGKYYARNAAVAQADAAKNVAEDQRRNVALDVYARLAQAEAAKNAVEVAQTAIASAEEAYRVTDALVKAGSATTTDLLDAQAALTQARLNLVRAKYQQALALVALERATGA